MICKCTSGVAQRSAYQAHNLRDGGSNPLPAIFVKKNLLLKFIRGLVINIDQNKYTSKLIMHLNNAFC